MDSNEAREMEAFRDSMEAEHGYRPMLWADGLLCDGRDRDRYAGWRLALAALSQQPDPKPDAEVWDDDIDDEHSCVAGGPAWQEGFNAGRATGRNEALDELRKAAPEARGVVDGEAVEKVIGEMSEYLAQEWPPELDTIEEWKNALTEARNVR